MWIIFRMTSISIQCGRIQVMRDSKMAMSDWLQIIWLNITEYFHFEVLQNLWKSQSVVRMGKGFYHLVLIVSCVSNKSFRIVIFIQWAYFAIYSGSSSNNEQLMYFVVAARRGSGWILGKFSFIFIEKTYNALDYNFIMIQIKRSFLLYQYILWLL
jgi:hypothetical protein